MNILFLDIDGCLRTHKSDLEWSILLNQPIPTKVFDRKFSKISVSNINYIGSITNCRIVVTSTWRNNFTLDELKCIFRENGIYVPLIDKTDIALTRGEEISEWLDFNDVDKYVIIDDQIKDIVSFLGSKNIVHCDHSIGFEPEELVEQVIDLLV